MNQAVTAYLSVGANLGDRRATIAQAIDLLDSSDQIRVIRQSDLLEYLAVGGPPDSPPYLNGVIEIQTTQPPQQLLGRQLEIERELGRVRKEKWGPRTIDLDLLLFGGQVLDQPGLSVPHPRLHERLFVLEPLAQLVPGLMHPVLRKSVSHLLAECRSGATRL